MIIIVIIVIYGLTLFGAATKKLVLGEGTGEALQWDEQYDFIVVEVDLDVFSALSLRTCNSSSRSLASTIRYHWTICQYLNSIMYLLISAKECKNVIRSKRLACDSKYAGRTACEDRKCCYDDSRDPSDPWWYEPVACFFPIGNTLVCTMHHSFFPKIGSIISWHGSLETNPNSKPESRIIN